MNPARILETLGAVIHQEDDAPPHRRGGGRAQSPIPPAGSVKPWQPPARRRRGNRRFTRGNPTQPANPPATEAP